MKKYFPTSVLITAILVGGLSRLDAGMTTVTVHNYTMSALTLQGITGGGLINGTFGFGGSPASPTHTTFVLNDAFEYNLGQYFNQTEGHRFTFVSGQVNPLGSPAESEFFEANGNDIYVSGVAIQFKLIAGSASQNICMNAGCFNGFAFPTLGGPAAIVVAPPADTNFNGLYPSIQFFGGGGANPATLRLGTNWGVASFSGTGHTFTPIDQFSGLATLSNGDQLLITVLPEPSTLGLVTLVMFACLGVRSKRRP